LCVFRPFAVVSVLSHGSLCVSDVIGIYTLVLKTTTPFLPTRSCLPLNSQLPQTKRTWNWSRSLSLLRLSCCPVFLCVHPAYRILASMAEIVSVRHCSYRRTTRTRLSQVSSSLCVCTSLPLIAVCASYVVAFSFDNGLFLHPLWQSIVHMVFPTRHSYRSWRRVPNRVCASFVNP
jgi:hypothetical protein